MNAQATFTHDAPPVLELDNLSIAYDGKTGGAQRVVFDSRR